MGAPRKRKRRNRFSHAISQGVMSYKGLLRKAEGTGLTFEDFLVREEGFRILAARERENPALAGPGETLPWRYLADERDFARRGLDDDDDLFLHEVIRDRKIGLATALRYEEETASEISRKTIPKLVVRKPIRSLQEIRDSFSWLRKRNARKALVEALAGEGWYVVPPYPRSFRKVMEEYDEKYGTERPSED